MGFAWSARRITHGRYSQFSRQQVHDAYSKIKCDDVILPFSEGFTAAFPPWL
jgi:hypothetical protein